MPFLRDQRATLDLYWLGPALILSIPALWQFVATVSPETSTNSAIAWALSGPFWFLLPVTIFEIIQRSIPPDHGKSGQYSIGPLGRLNQSYVDQSGPGHDLRHALVTVLILSIVAAMLLIPAAVATGWQDPGLVWIPGLAVGTYSVAQLLPSLPGVGGYALRDIFWFLNQDVLAGSRAAFLYSQITASGLLLFSGYLLLWHSHLLVVAAWGLFLAIYIIRCGRQELMRTTLIKRARHVVAADALAGLNPTIRAAAEIPDALDILLEQRDNGPALVRDRTRYIGMLDLSAVEDTPRGEWPSMTAADLATPFEQLVESPAGATLLEVLASLQREPDSAVIVRERDGRIVGLVDRTIEARSLLRRGISRTPANPSTGGATKGS